MEKKLKANTVQQTLCIPLWGRMIATRHYPHLFPDPDAERIVKETGCDLSGSRLYKIQYEWLNCMVRQYDLACEISGYLEGHPNATVVELGAGLSTLRRQMRNDTNRWYNLDLPEVVSLRERHIPTGERERNVPCNLHDFSWFDTLGFQPGSGIVFVAGGLFYYFKKEQVRRLFRAMAKRFRGGMIAFDATNALGLKGVNKEVGLAGNETKSFFSLEHPKAELESWSPDIVSVSERDYMRGYLEDTGMFSPVTQIIMRVAARMHVSFMVHVEFRKVRTD